MLKWILERLDGVVWAELICRIKGFLDFVHHPDSKELEDKNMMFWKLDPFPSSGEGRHLFCSVP
jgi:hypothetical protein